MNNRIRTPYEYVEYRKGGWVCRPLSKINHKGHLIRYWRIWDQGKHFADFYEEEALLLFVNKFIHEKALLRAYKMLWEVIHGQPEDTPNSCIGMEDCIDGYYSGVWDNAIAESRRLLKDIGIDHL